MYYEENISKMLNFDKFSLLECRKRKFRSHDIRKKGNDKRKMYASMKSNISLHDLSTRFREQGRHAMLSFLCPLPVVVLYILDTEANRFNERNQCMTVHF